MKGTVCSVQVTTKNSHRSLLATLGDLCMQILNIKCFHITNWYSTSRVASFPGSPRIRTMESWVGPGNEATSRVPLQFGLKFQKWARLLNLQEESSNV